MRRKYSNEIKLSSLVSSRIDRLECFICFLLIFSSVLMGRTYFDSSFEALT